MNMHYDFKNITTRPTKKPLKYMHEKLTKVQIYDMVVNIVSKNKNSISCKN